MEEIKLILCEKDLVPLREFLRRWNRFNQEEGFEEVTLRDAAYAILSMGLDENPAEKYYPNYKEQQSQK